MLRHGGQNVAEYFQQVFGEPFVKPPYELPQPGYFDQFTDETECGIECMKAIDAFKCAHWYSSNAGEPQKLVELCRSACMVLIFG